MKKVLLVYPEFPPSFWGCKHAIEFIGKKSVMPPLGLLTVAGMFPENGYELKLIDMNITSLEDEHITWADFVLTSTMIVQQKSLREVIARCNRIGVPIVAGGPHPTSFHDQIKGVDHFVLDEVEEIFPQFLEDFGNGGAKKMYRAPEKPDVTKTPLSRFDLLDLDAYRSMALQFSRGCPFDCEFCDITKLFGRIPRTKTNDQMLAELDFLYDLGWRGPVFLVDDNFVGNKRDAMRLLHAIAGWQKEKGHPFSLYTEASVTLVEFEPLMDAMVDAGLNMVFLGIESPNPETLKKSNKNQNIKKGVDNYLLHAVRTLQGKGIEVTGGFILGLDGDGPEVFDAQIDFIKEAGIPIAMVGILNALRGTTLYNRLEREGRLLAESTGNNLDITLNFIPEMDRQMLINGYKRILTTLYDPTLSNYFQRCWTQLKNLKLTEHNIGCIGKAELLAAMRSFRRQLFSKQGPAYLKFLLKTIFRYPKMFPEAVRLAIMGYHFQKHTEQALLSSKVLPK
ncbi:MAG: B12-binding domain-containing radical SAM protein [Candidatus Brocadiales bacterium]